MISRPGGDAVWVMWVGPRQWEDLPGEFDVGQSGWVYPQDEAAELFSFFPAFGAGNAWSYGVVCAAQDFLRFTTHEHP